MVSGCSKDGYRSYGAAASADQELGPSAASAMLVGVKLIAAYLRLDQVVCRTRLWLPQISGMWVEQAVEPLMHRCVDSLWASPQDEA